MARDHSNGIFLIFSQLFEVFEANFLIKLFLIKRKRCMYSYLAPLTKREIADLLTLYDRFQRVL